MIQPDPDECQHENVEYDPGNYVPPYGWEQYPGMYCLDCGEPQDDPYDAHVPDYDDRAHLEDEARNPL